MPIGTAAEGPVAILYYPNSVTLPRGYPAYDLVQGADSSAKIAYERPRSGPLRGQDITVVNQTFEGGHWISVKTTDSAGVSRELDGALHDMANKSGALRLNHPLIFLVFFQCVRMHG